MMQKWLKLVWLVLSVNVAWANTETVISGIYDGQHPYLVVQEDPDGNSKRDPGIYTPNAEGKWNLLIPGRVLTGGAYQGLIAQLSLSKLDQRYASLAVVDGKLKLLQSHPSNQPSQSVLTFDESVELTDIHGTPVTIPEITRIEQIVVWAGEEGEVGQTEKEGQTVLVSIKSELSPMGNGITFGFVVAKGDSSEPAKIQLLGHPTVIDYRFTDYDQLGALETRSNGRVISPILIRETINKKQKSSPKVVEEWKHQIQRDLKRVEIGLPPKSIEFFPLFDLVEGHPHLEIPPKYSGRFSWNSGRFRYDQKYDPISRQNELLFYDSMDSEESRLVVDGQLEYRESDQRYHLYPSKSNASHLLVYLNSKPTFLKVEPGGSVPVALYPLEVSSSDLPMDVAFLTRTIGKSSGGFEHYLILSSAQLTQQRTVAYILNEPSDGLFYLKRKVHLTNTYIPIDELDARVVLTGQAEQKNQEVLFDDRTPVQGFLSAYRQNFVPTLPVLNISQSASGRRVTTYIEALEERRVSNGSAIFRKYQKVPGEEDPTGLTILNRKGNSIETYRGELLQLPGVRGPEIYSVGLKLGETNLQGRLSVFAIDAGFKHGLESYQLVAVLSSESDKNTPSYFDPLRTSIKVKRGFDTFVGCKFGLRKRKDTFEFTWVTGEQGRNESDPRSLLVKSFSLSLKEKDGEGNLKLVDGTLLVRSDLSGDLDAQTLQHRVKFDTSGYGYWIMTPELDPKSSEYQAIHLETGLRLFPNRDGKPIQFKDSDQLQEIESEKDEPGSGMRAYFNKWKLWAETDVMRVSGHTLEELAALKDSVKPFPGLKEYLNQVGDSSTPVKHEVFLVASDYYEKFKDALTWVLFQDRSNQFYVNSSSASLSYLSETPGNLSEILSTMEQVRRSATKSRKSILFGTLDGILKVRVPGYSTSDSENFLLNAYSSETGGEDLIPPHLAYLLASEGKNIELSNFKARNLPEQKIHMVLIGTPEEWWKLQHVQNGILLNSGVFDTFEVNRQYLTGSWKLWEPESGCASNEIVTLSRQPSSDLESEIFPDVGRYLNEMADLKKPARHKVLLMSKDLKPLIKKMIVSKWASPPSEDSFFNHRNRGMSLYRIENNKTVDQTDIFENFSAMRGNASQQRPVLMVDLQDIQKNSRPHLPYRNAGAFTIQDWVSSVGNSQKEVTPHFLYLLDTEGRPLSLEEASVFSSERHEVSILLMGDESEWEAIKKDLDLEARINLAGRFETLELQSPTRESRQQLLYQLVNSPEIKRLGYRFESDVPGRNIGALSAQEAEEKLLRLLVSRTETLAQQYSEQSISAFLKVLGAFRSALIEDPELRVAKVIDRAYLERLLSKVFSIPLNLNILAPHDPYVQLSHERAPLRLQEAGYRGPLELKAQVIRTLLAPTRNNSTSAVPGSIIVFGDTSTGKTLLFKTVVKLLGLKEYDFNDPMNENAGYLMLNVGRLTSEKTSSSAENMSVYDALKHINHFLSLPNGYRGYILLDDMHKGDKEVIKVLLKFLQSLLDAEKGMIRVERMGARGEPVKVVEIPVRHIHPWITLNPTTDQQKLERYSKGGKGDDVDIVVATLSTDDNPIERSFLARWGLVLNVSKFPLDAKAPALNDSLRASSRNDFNVQGRLILVTPQVVNSVVAAFPNSNAREFLSAATGRLLQGPVERADNGSLFVVIPAKTGQRGFSWLTENQWKSASWKTSAKGRDSDWGASGLDHGKIESFITQATVTVPVSHGIEGKVHLLSNMVDAFRTSVYESLVDSSAQDERFAAGPKELKMVLSPFLHGLTSNFSEKDYLPLSLFNLDPVDFVQTKVDRPEFLRLIEDGKLSPRQFYGFHFSDGLEQRGGGTGLLGENYYYEPDRTRSDVVLEFSSKISDVMRKFLMIFLRVDSQILPEPEAWLKDLKVSEPQAELYQLGSELASLYLEFWSQLHDPSLLENRSDGQYDSPNGYDVARIFAAIVDRSITQLPWGRINRFIIRALEVATTDMEIGQRPEVQHYLFTSRLSLLRPTDHEHVFQMATSSQAYQQWSAEKKIRMQNQFKAKVSHVFVSKSESR